MPGLCPQTKKDWATICCCMPLSAGALLVSFYLGALGGYELYHCFNSPTGWDWLTILLAVLAGFKILCAVGGLLAVTLKSGKGAGMLLCGFNIVKAVMISMFLVQWVTWALNMAGVGRADKWQPNTLEIVDMSIYTVLYVAFFAVSCYIQSMLKSLVAVIGAGGSGWEKRNFKDLQADKALAAEDTDDEV